MIARRSALAHLACVLWGLAGHLWHEWVEYPLDGHISLGRNVTVYGANAMHWGVTVRTQQWGYVCFRLPLRCFGRWWPLYLYCSPNGTPWAATFMVGRDHDPDDCRKAPLRRKAFGHNFDTEKHRAGLRYINDRC